MINELSPGANFKISNKKLRIYCRGPNHDLIDRDMVQCLAMLLNLVWGYGVKSFSSNNMN